ncbi:MAG TPA: peptidoglycan editing factor PgeF [Zoogloea sp.]|uniref:peptidoglycan editing factor PgeF n=1 Tax=Zoogloea sp. TaxID=49181 RepID=UPI002B7D1C14|nr:peptidoglycan editing factor PgeF [Zoogloea sp.]HMV17264.1 peptidoglycan editing factor PgeF [Rhodocyclaceae bacterium]HMV63376.1 peptidoglycan editing factor PgeF [Rhodocyclaceae bacterium]HMW51212.1 peptidoglycan editing factor PgeF [Rhodocyclaceae bacterium]HMY50006.1 peptidoglycan editing factor PgeF [Rhodocyclaceae bacterium]HMZ76377.1 peptidoglycan editing factor PgeF [Rhodocyclaceae bacterium]
MSNGNWIVPDWPAPACVRALSTTRLGGVSPAPWDSLNLGTHVQDDPARVLANRAILRAQLPADPVWLNQVHGTTVVDAAVVSGIPDADAAIARASGAVCVVMTADCLPVLLCDRAGTVVGAAHAGWRGLHGGVIEATLAAMGVAPHEVLAWLGPAIGPAAFEVGDEVRAAFVADDEAAASAFLPGAAPDKWLADLYRLACQRLARAGVTRVSGGGLCTVADRRRFFSYRRDGLTGRMASLVWLAAPDA